MLYQLGCDLKLPVSFTKDGQPEQPTPEPGRRIPTISSLLPARYIHCSGRRNCNSTSTQHT